MSEPDVVFYSAEQSPDRLIHEDVSEAIEDAVDQWDRAPTMDDTIQVTSYRSMKLPSRERIAEWLIQDITERLDPEYSDPDSYSDSLPQSEVFDEAMALAAAIRKHYKVWACEPVKTWTERVADHVPVDWLKGESR